MSKLKVPANPRDHISGGGNPIVWLVEYGDYECPFCAAAQPNVRRVQSQFGEKLALVYRHFPMTEIHPHALMAAQTAEFAGEQVGFGIANGAPLPETDKHNGSDPKDKAPPTPEAFAAAVDK